MIAVNRYYAPSTAATAQLLTDLLEDQAARGTHVTFITSRNGYNGHAATLPIRETLNGVHVHRVWTSHLEHLGLAGRAIDYATFYLTAFIALIILTRRGDTILANTDPPLMSIPAALVCRLRAARLVNWCHDLFPEVADAVGMRWAGGPVGQLLCRLRNRSFRKAATNIVLNQTMRAHLAAQAVPDDRLRVLHHWSIEDSAHHPRNRQPGEPFTICYSGNLGRVHKIDAIIDLVDRTWLIPGLQWRFVGGGSAHARLQAAIAQHGWSNVTFAPYAPRHELGQSLAACDVHLVSLDPACEGLVQPSKIYGILAVGRPALFIGSPTGGIARMLDRHDAGLTLSVDAPETWAPMLGALIDDQERRAAMGRNARRAYEERYAREHAFAAWAEVLAAEPAAAAEPKRLAA